MFSKILVATDLSEISDNVISAIGDLKVLGTRDALLLHCLNIREVGTLADQIVELREPYFERQKKALQKLGFNVTAKMVMGLPQIEINRQAVEHDCSLIVVGSVGGTMAQEILLGGVASAVINNATRPALIFRQQWMNEKSGKKDKQKKWNPLEHVLFPTDFSDNAEHAFSYMKKITESGAKRITILHVQDQEKIDRHLKNRLEEFNQIDTERLQRLKKDLEKAGAKDVRTELPYGLPKKEIINRIGQQDISLVVLGSQGRGYFGEIVLGSVSHYVARHSKAPVLLIPAIQ
ncbi:MAG TPA: universal stress protein [bacterium]|nr:universal stress protein [bacterium]HOX86879.1 universal stress protein [bacterium]HPG46210.1 universal stress protein [bacterium]HPM98596.1 universal stress protein [bacterium]